MLCWRGASGIRSAGQPPVVPLVYDNGGGGSTKGLEVFAQQELWHHLDGWLFYIYSVADIAASSGASPTTSPIHWVSR